jgi:hypothetical protein
MLIGKKQLNQLITLLDKEGGIRGSNRNADNALRSVRAKREAEDAGALIIPINPCFIAEPELDKDYRKAVHWLETLRIRRVKILEGGYNVSDMSCYAVGRCCVTRPHSRFAQSLERFIYEGTETVKTVLVTYADTMMSVLLKSLSYFHESYTLLPIARHMPRKTIWRHTPAPQSRKFPVRPIPPFWRHPSAALLPSLFLHPLCTITTMLVNVRTWFSVSP